MLPAEGKKKIICKIYVYICIPSIAKSLWFITPLTDILQLAVYVLSSENIYDKECLQRLLFFLFKIQYRVSVVGVDFENSVTRRTALGHNLPACLLLFD